MCHSCYTSEPFRLSLLNELQVLLSYAKFLISLPWQAFVLSSNSDKEITHMLLWETDKPLSSCRLSLWLCLGIFPYYNILVSEHCKLCSAIDTTALQYGNMCTESMWLAGISTADLAATESIVVFHFSAHCMSKICDTLAHWFTYISESKYYPLVMMYRNDH